MWAKEGAVKKLVVLFLLVLLLAGVLVVAIVGLGKKPEKTGSLRLYYLNDEETRVLNVPYEPAAKDRDALAEELVGRLTQRTEDIDYAPPLGEKIGVLSWHIQGEQLYLDLDPAYKELSTVREVLVRAAIVRILTQIPGVNYVSITLAGEPLLDALELPVGAMSTDSFIENAGNEINTYERITLHLYFTDASGKKLISTNRSIVYNSNISLERLVAEQLIQGPALKDQSPVVSSTTKVLNVAIRDQICYLNLDSGFLIQQGNVQPEIKLYAFVNSLTELPQVNRVQISVNGDTSPVLGETLSLDVIYERNRELLGEE